MIVSCDLATKEWMPEGRNFLIALTRQVEVLLVLPILNIGVEALVVEYSVLLQ